MGVHVTWDNDEKTAIRYDLAGRWTWDEFFPVYQQATQMIAPLEYKVEFIVNLADEVTQKGFVPPNLLSRLSDLNKHQPPNVGATYVVGVPFLKVLYNVAVKVYPVMAERYVYVTSLEEARQLIALKVNRNAKLNA